MNAINKPETDHLNNSSSSTIMDNDYNSDNDRSGRMSYYHNRRGTMDEASTTSLNGLLLLAGASESLSSFDDRPYQQRGILQGVPVMRCLATTTNFLQEQRQNPTMSQLSSPKNLHSMIDEVLEICDGKEVW